MPSRADQRRYTEQTLRRLVFIGMLQDAGLRLEQARAYLAGSLLCRYDHPADECRTMNAEIDRRLARASAS